MALKPVLKVKVDELFLRWLSEPDTQQLLKTNLRQIIKGESVTNARQTWPQSPRLRAGASSPSTPPCSPSTSKVLSPRSPRRPVYNKHLVKQLNSNFKAPREDANVIFGRDVKGSTAPVTPSPLTTTTTTTNTGSSSPTASVPRGEPDGEAESFLRQKEAQLREKRERERLQKELEKKQKELKDRESNTHKPVNRVTEKVTNDKGSSKPADIQTDRVTEKQTAPSIKDKAQTEALSTSAKVPNKQQSQQTQEKTKKKEPPPTEKKPDVRLTDKTKTPTGVKVPKQPSVPIPQFYFPLGKPTSEDLEATLTKIKDAFGKIEGGKASKIQMGAVAKACGLSMYWRCPLFHASGGDKAGHVTLQQFLALWKKVTSTCHDESSRFVRILAKPGCNYIVAEDFVPFIQDIVDNHPGLAFLQDAPEFHSRYVHTVIARIYYCVNRSWSGKITIPELRKSNFLQTLALLDEEDDINQITDYFSYEHFYVIYCKFWELDKDHDLFISKEDLARHNDHAISQRMIERIFSGCVTRGRAQKEGKMSYTEFVWFLISEEDKRHPTSIEYWFRCMDVDGDGIISMYEMEYFYEEMVQRMEAMGIETLPFEDCLCQMLDMVRPLQEGKITLSDLKKSQMTPLFFDTFFNLEKYLEHEQKDPFANLKDQDEPEVTDWERYAADEYEILVAEEGAADANQDDLAYEDDFEADDDETSKSPEPIVLPSKSAEKSRPKSSDGDIYDFSTANLGY